MSLLKNLVAVAALLACSQQWADARIPKSPSPPENNVPAHGISKYTTEYFLDTVRYNDIPCNSCLFYTFNLTATAQRYSRSGKSALITIWDIWPSDFYNGDIKDVKNPLRSIFSDAVNTRTYYENMSTVMAQLCSGFTMVMTKDPKNIPMDGIWGRFEFPTLQRDDNRGGQVHTVIAIDADGDGFRTSWTHPRPKSNPCERLPSKMKMQTLAKRQGFKRYSPDELQTWFSGVPF